MSKKRKGKDTTNIKMVGDMYMLENGKKYDSVIVAMEKNYELRYPKVIFLDPLIEEDLNNADNT